MRMKTGHPVACHDKTQHKTKTKRASDIQAHNPKKEERMERFLNLATLQAANSKKRNRTYFRHSPPTHSPTLSGLSRHAHIAPAVSAVHKSLRDCNSPSSQYAAHSHPTAAADTVVLDAVVVCAMHLPVSSSRLALGHASRRVDERPRTTAATTTVQSQIPHNSSTAAVAVAGPAGGAGIAVAGRSTGAYKRTG